MRNNRDLALYAGIGGFTAALGYVGSGDLPHWLLAPCGIILAVLIAIKAKLSLPNPDPPPQKIFGIKIIGSVR